MNYLFDLKDLSAGYGSQPVIDGLQLSVRGGQIVGLLGRNGAGISTALRTAAGLLPARRGAVWLGDDDLTRLSPRQRTQRGLSYVAQDRHCFPDLSLRENVEAALLCFDLTAAERRRRCDEALSHFPELAPWGGQPAVRLSGGMRQMLVLAMGLAQRPRCLLLDEPSLGLGQGVLDKLGDILRRYTNGGGAVLLVEQKPRVAFAAADYLYYLEGGRIAVSGAPAELRENRNFVDRFLGLRLH